jgi:hypothetical protein
MSEKITLNDPKDKDNVSIKCEKLLAVEGQDEWWFFKRFLEKHLKINDVQLIDIGGESKFEDKLKALKLSPNFSTVKKIGFVRDADNDVIKSFQKIKTAIDTCLKITSPSTMNSWEGSLPKLGVFVLPNSLDNGMLEDLFLESVANDPFMPCLENYIQCIESKIPRNQQPKNKAKSKAQAFLASRKDYKSSVGLAAEAGYWNFDAPCMDELKKFLDEFK